MKIAILTLCLLTIISVPLFAKQKPYVGANYTIIDYSDDHFDVECHTAGIIFGTLIVPQFAIEGRFAVGTINETIYFDVPLGYIDCEVQYIYGIYPRFIFPISDTFNFYGLLGYTWIEDEYTGELLGVKIYETDHENDISYGLGGEININSRISGAFEYMRLIDKSDYTYSGMSFRLKINF